MSIDGSELQDLSDDADYAASQQQGSVSMMRCENEKRNSTSEHEGADLIYLKENVAIHPTQFTSERISGRLKLTKLDSAIFLDLHILLCTSTMEESRSWP